MTLDKIQLERIADGEEIRDFDGTYRKPTAWEATFARTILTMQAAAPQPERADGWCPVSEHYGDRGLCSDGTSIRIDVPDPPSKYTHWMPLPQPPREGKEEG